MFNDDNEADDEKVLVRTGYDEGVIEAQFSKQTEQLIDFKFSLLVPWIVSLLSSLFSIPSRH